MSESICDLANELLKCDDWDPRTLHAMSQVDVPACEYLNNDVPFAIARELIVDIPVDPRGYPGSQSIYPAHQMQTDSRQQFPLRSK